MSWLSSPALVAPDWIRPYAQPFADTIGLPKLGPTLHLAIYSCAASFALQKLSSILSPIVASKHYPKIKRKQDDWDLHIVGWAFSLFAAPLAFHLIRNPSPELGFDPLTGSALREERLSAIAAGYFVWDTFVSTLHINTQGFGFFLHGIGCCIAFSFTLRPFLLWCGPCFLIWEVSTIFLNMHWFLDKTNRTGSLLQMINGFFLVSAYIVCRLIFGVYNSYKLFVLLFSTSSVLTKATQEGTGWIRYLYLAINLTMNGLNFFWFRAMLLALRKRFVSPSSAEARKQPIQVDGKLNWSKGDKKGQ
ncbi:hypothetical protein JCM3766R1_004567 [Sporobolomyces carnicolor]